MITIKKGLNLPITGEPDEGLSAGPEVSTVGLIADDYHGMKPTFLVQEGERVTLGQPLFSDKKNSKVTYTSPGCGIVQQIRRGDKRKFLSITIALEGNDEEQFSSYKDSSLDSLTREQVCENLLKSGLWTALRTRPYSKVPNPDSVPRSIFITAIDTNPLAPNPERILEENETNFIAGLSILRHLTKGNLFLCCAKDANIPGDDLSFVKTERFAGPHPAGLPGTHIHFLDPVGENKTVWYIGSQDVVAFGHLFLTGKLWIERVVTLAGPSVKKPRTLKTRLGANLLEFCDGELDEGENRIVSGSVLSGRQATETLPFLGRYHTQISALKEGRDRELFGWNLPGFHKFSVKRVFASAFANPAQKFDFNTTTHGSRRAMVPVGSFEQVVPLDVIPTFLLRALIVGDTERAQELGCLELDEEDLALCTFVSPGKSEYGPILRKNLETIEKEG